MPEPIIAAIPDIHGEAHRLEKLIQYVQRHWPEVKLVFLGNYINYGAESAQVLRMVKHMTGQGHIALRGHEEELLLEYIYASEPNAWDRLRFSGGCQTIRSFEREARDWFQSPAALREYLAKAGMLAWLEDLPVFYRENNLVFTSAPVSPEGWTWKGSPRESEALTGSAAGFDEDAYAKQLASPAGCFAICGHERTVPRKFRQGISAPVPDSKTPVVAFVTDKGDILRAGEATHWPKDCGDFGPMLFRHGLYLDCGCGSHDDGALVAAVLRSRGALLPA
jgi:hypothetical protein